jgi:hypothetical protein
MSYNLENARNSRGRHAGIERNAGGGATGMASNKAAVSRRQRFASIREIASFEARGIGVFTL